MKSPVIVKGNKYGFQIVLDWQMPFDQLLEEVGKKFGESAGFFAGSGAVAVSFDGRNLSLEEEEQLIDAIEEASGLRIPYLIDENSAVPTRFAEALAKIPEEPEVKEPAKKAEKKAQDAPAPAAHSELAVRHGEFYRGILRSGQRVEAEGSIVIVGDINPGAMVVSGGNVVVLGSLKGTVVAGYPDDEDAIVAALVMEPMQIQIGKRIARSPDQEQGAKKKPGRKKVKREMEPGMAFIDKGNIFIEPITRSLINEISTR